MVAAFLQDDLAAELGNILKDFRLKDPQGNDSKINIFLQYLPMPEPLEQDDIPVEMLENGLADQQTAPDPYPYIVVRIDDGEIKDEDSAQTVDVNLLIGTYEPDYDKQGHKDVLNIIARLYERFAKVPVLNGKYTIQYPVLWALQGEESYPFYFGGMNLTFEIAAVRREDEYS
jgi:hypothetical protein